MELRDQRALVTGGTSGIGRAVAGRLAQAGASVVISGRNAERGAETVAAIEADGGSARFIAADMADLAAVRRLADQAGDVDILVNNAGLFTFASALSQDLGGLQAMFDVNVRAPFLLTATLAPKMLAKGTGAIVNVSTIAAQVALPDHAAYGATKAALDSLTRAWAVEFAGSGVRVNSVAPGPTRTEGVLTALGDDQVERAGGLTPLARPADPAEIAEVVAFLASPRSSYVTGATLAADGGILVTVGGSRSG